MTPPRLLLSLAVAVAAVLSIPASAAAEPAVGVVAGTNVLAGFDTAVPGTFTALRPIAGLSGPAERVLGLDFRHNPSEPTQPPRLFALGVTRAGANDDLRLYTIDPGTAVATQVGAAPISVTTTVGAGYGFDFNPTVDRIRVVNSADLNLRLNPSTGALSALDAPITPAGGQISALAYDRVQLAPTLPANSTAYALSLTLGQLGTIGGINQVPSPNGGQFMAVGGPLGVPLDAGSTLDFDISLGGTAYATATSGSAPGLYAIDLPGGAATLIGRTVAPLAGLAILPATTVAFSAAAVTAPESAGTATINVTRSGSTSPSTSVAWSAGNGPGGTLAFAPGESTKAIAIPIAADAVDEPDETIPLTLSSPSFPATVGTPATAIVTIVDDDPAPGVRLTRVPKSITYAKLVRRGIRVTATPNAPAALQATLLGTTRRARLSRFNVALASKRLRLAPGARTLRLRPSRKALRRPRHRVKLRVQVVATDAAGKRAVARRTVRLKPR